MTNPEIGFLLALATFVMIALIGSAIILRSGKEKKA
jgi:hypothetical protein